MSDSTHDVTTMLQDPVAQRLLRSTIPARLAYIGEDGAPNVVPVWFHWTGEAFVVGSTPHAPKVAAIRAHPQVALAIDDAAFPYKALTVRGTATVEMQEGVVPEYAASARRYFGDEQGAGWVQQMGTLFPGMARISIRPEHAVILDFERRFPQEIAQAMAAH